MALLRVYFLKVFANKTYGMTAIVSNIKQRKRTAFHHTCHREIGFVMHQNVWLAESSPAHALWRHDRDINHQNKVFLSIFQGWLAMFMEEHWTSKHNINGMQNMPI